MFRKRTILLMEMDQNEIRVLCRPKNFLKKNLSISAMEIRPSITLPCMVYLDETNKEILVKALKDYRMSQWGTGKVPVFLLLPYQNGLIRILKLPWIAGKYRDKAVSYSIENEIPSITGQIVYRYHVIEEKKNDYLAVALMGIRKDTLSFYVDCFHQAGYDLQGAEYTITAFGKALGHPDDKSILYLRMIRSDYVQAVRYHNGLPAAVNLIAMGEKTTLNYQLYLILKDCQVPLDLIITDRSDQTSVISGQLMNAGYAKRMDILNCNHEQKALMSEIQRIANKENINFCVSHFRSGKINTLAFLSSMILVVIILLGSLTCSHLNAQNKNEEEIAVLEEVITTQKEKIDAPLKMDGIYAREKVLSDFQYMQVAFNKIGGDILLTRVAYKLGSLQIWADCSDNAKIVTAMNTLTVYGWGKPQLVEYHCKEGKIDFCLSVER